MPDPRPTLLVVLPTDRDDEWLASPWIARQCRIEPLGSLADVLRDDFDEGAFFDSSVARLAARSDVAGVIGTDDFPASFVAALVGERLSLPAPPVSGVFLAQHKAYSRDVQARAAPDATPRSTVIDLARPPRPEAPPLPFPFFAKPVKSFASVLSRQIDDAAALARLLDEARTQLPSVARGFDDLVARSRIDPMFRLIGSQALVAEELIRGRQVTLDGFVDRGRVHVIGIVDSHFLEGTRSFQRFEAPSDLPWSVQERMADVARRVVLAHGLDRVVFNVELCWDRATDAIRVIELNPRMASQFVPIYRALFGIDLYAIQVALALGREVDARDTFAPPDAIVRAHGAAASFVLRSREDAVVRRVPAPAEIAALRARFDGARVELLAADGERLSDHFQDGETFRYAIVDLRARGRAELQEAFEAASGMLRFEMG